MSNDNGERMIATVHSARYGAERLENRARVMLDEIHEELDKNGGMPWGMVLEGRITLDVHGNQSLYVFLQVTDAAGDSEIYTGRSGVGNEGERIPEAKGGKWISLTKRGIQSFDAAWEARDLVTAVKNYRAVQFAAAKK